jgi:hypothetical protein
MENAEDPNLVVGDKLVRYAIMTKQYLANFSVLDWFVTLPKSWVFMKKLYLFVDLNDYAVCCGTIIGSDVLVYRPHPFFGFLRPFYVRHELIRRRNSASGKVRLASLSANPRRTISAYASSRRID